MSDASRTRRRQAPDQTAVLVVWYGLTAVGGAFFGLLVDRPPFGDGFLLHPVVMFFILVGLSLLALRVVLAQPVPSVISDRALIAGCVVGLVAFLGANVVGVHYGVRLF